MEGAILVTGATGLIGGGVLARLLAADPSLRAYALTRDPARLARGRRPAGCRGRAGDAAPGRPDPLRPGPRPRGEAPAGR